jgi:hypothetical protein
MDIFVVAILLGLIPAIIAQQKGRSFIVFWIYGALVFIIALPHAFLMNPTAKALGNNTLAQSFKKCIYCAQIIKTEFNVCQYCGQDV